MIKMNEEQQQVIQVLAKDIDKDDKINKVQLLRDVNNWLKRLDALEKKQLNTQVLNNQGQKMKMKVLEAYDRYYAQINDNMKQLTKQMSKKAARQSAVKQARTKNIYKALQDVRNTNTIQGLKADMLNLLQQGYLLIMNCYNAMAGKEKAIKYRIYIKRKDNRIQILQFDSIDALLKSSLFSLKLDRDNKRSNKTLGTNYYKLRMSYNSKALNIANDNFNITDLSQDDILWKDLIAWQNIHNSEQNSSKINLGNLVEIHNYLLSYFNSQNFTYSSLRKDDIKNDPNMFNFFNKVSNKVLTNSTKFYEGGDYQNIQIKSFLGRDVSISTTATIRNVIIQMKSILQSSNNIENIQNNLEDLFKLKGTENEISADNTVDQELTKMEKTFRKR